MKNWHLGCIVALGLLAVTPVEKAHAVPVNVALGATTGASSQTYGAAALAVDGNTDTTYGGGSVFESNLETNPYWYVSLPQQYALSSISIFQRTDYGPTLLNDFTVSVFDSLDNVTFTQTYAPNPSDTVSTPFNISFASVVQGKAVQILLDSASPQYLALAEVQVFTDVPEPASIALFGAGVLGLAAVGRKARGRSAA